jgi:hypothetical protein
LIRAANYLVLETVDPGREPRKRSDREHDSIVIDRLQAGNQDFEGKVGVIRRKHTYEGNPGTVTSLLSMCTIRDISRIG